MHDDEHLRQLLNLHLWRAGYDVRLAGNAVDASVLILEAAPDVMILDVNTQGMGGFDFLAGVRADRTVPFFPAVFLTEDKGAATSARARGLGAACLLKPVQIDKLLTAIALSTLIQRPRSRRDARPDVSPAAATEALFRFRCVSRAHDL
ncbi:MAG TPA: response regulator [Burkholderiales bacterium]|nr:response regulator [Burkholderiales bacterium]